MEKVYSYELSNRLIDENIGSAFSACGMPLYSPIQYFCRPEIFEKYGDECIRHPSDSCLHSGFVRSVLEFAVAGYDSDESEVDESDEDESDEDESDESDAEESGGD